MMNSKKLILFSVLLLLILQGSAQTAEDEERTAHIASLLSVSPDKASAIAGALNYHTALIKETARDTSMDFGQRRALLKKLHIERQKKISSVLTEEQREKCARQEAYEKMRQRREAQREAVQQALEQRSTASDGESPSL